MLFKLAEFLVFFTAIYIPYLFLNHKWQNRLLLAASTLFYAAWDWRFIVLIFTSVTTDYLCGLKICGTDDERIRKRFLILSIIVNLSILGFFKYFNFFAANFAQLVNYLGFSIHYRTLQILLPIGISFYTFKTISYTVDVYLGKIKPTRSYRDYALFVTFFPLILAGPIMRAGDLLRQIEAPRKPQLEGFYEGCYLIFWGIFQKFFVADNLARLVDPVFNSSPPYPGAQMLLALYAFAFQIYCDFAGYSNIAIGLGRCMGFDIMNNFNLPYFSTNPQDFWNRWHISLSTWLSDYIYNPVALSMRRWGAWSVAVSLMVTFILCGLWHGASWAFVTWGAYWGSLLVIYYFIKPSLKNMYEPKSNIMKISWFIIRIIFFFQLVCLGWLIFRAGSISMAVNMLRSIIFNFGPGADVILFLINIFQLTWILLLAQCVEFVKNDKLAVYRSSTLIRAALYIICFYAIFLYGAGSGKDFIYFQF